MKLTKKCPICNKAAEVVSESKISNLIVTHYQCGHVRAKSIPKIKDLELISNDGLKPFKYQLEGASFGIKANGRVLIADECGVGKTLQSFLIAHSDPDEYLPILIICKNALKIQMQKEALRWCSWYLQILENEDDMIIPGIPGYIIGYDSLAYFEYESKKGKKITRGIKDLSAFVDKVQPRTVILDECQKIKNSEAKRTKAVQDIMRHDLVEHKIALSGDPIENNAGEYFPILNMLYPEKFPNKNSYVARWCDSYFNMNSGTQKIGGIKDVKGFKDFTKDFIIRRTRKEVLPDLPSIDRRFRFEELGEKVEEAYKEEFKKFQDYYYYGGDDGNIFQRDGNIIAYLSKMRHLTGIAKIPGVVDFVEEFIQETDRKIVVFTHHKDVAAELISRIANFYPNVIHLDAPVDARLVDKFWLPDNRIMIASTLAAGEGLNLQCCSDCIMMERQWNPSKEGQAEGRFPRPGQTSDKITATYFTAVGTVDEFFAELVEQKRSIVASTLDGKEVKWNESALISELAEILASKGGRKWGW